MPRGDHRLVKAVFIAERGGGREPLNARQTLELLALRLRPIAGVSPKQARAKHGRLRRFAAALRIVPQGPL
jgi:hypothetical protein